MTDRSAPRRGWSAADRPDDDGWGPSTATYSSSPRQPNGRDDATSRSGQPQARAERRPPADPWSSGLPPTRDKQRANRQMDRQIAELRRSSSPKERGLPWWAALILLVAIAAVGGLVDTIGTTAARGGFNIGIVVASIVAIVLVRRSHMFPIVIAPPIVYTLAAVFQLYLRSSGLHDKKVIYDAASNYLVYGFPAIAGATAAVLIIAGFRLITRK